MLYRRRKSLETSPQRSVSVTAAFIASFAILLLVLFWYGHHNQLMCCYWFCYCHCCCLFVLFVFIFLLLLHSLKSLFSYFYCILMAKCAGDAFDEWERKFEVEKSDPEESLSDRGRGERKFSRGNSLFFSHCDRSVWESCPQLQSIMLMIVIKWERAIDARFLLRMMRVAPFNQI